MRILNEHAMLLAAVLVFFGLAFILPTVRVWRQTGRNPYVLPVSDDAYGFVPPDAPAPFAALAPELTWHIAGLSKCLGAGLRLAYVVVPDLRSGWPFAAALRASNIMASPLTAALATHWIEDGSADALLDFLRVETAARHGLPFVAPPLWLCTDNAAMIAWAGAERFGQGLVDGLEVQARARWPLDPDAAPVRGAGVKA